MPKTCSYKLPIFLSKILLKGMVVGAPSHKKALKATPHQRGTYVTTTFDTLLNWRARVRDHGLDIRWILKLSGGI